MLTINILGSNEKDDYDACLASLFLTEPKDDREKLVNVKGSRVDGTCTWIRDNALYKTWTQSHSQCLWISGGPGKGKTMLSIFIAEELEKRIQPPSKELLLQFFCDNKDKNRNTATAIVSSLVYQLLRMRPQLFSHIENDFKARKWSTKSETARWPYETLWRIFEIMLSDPVLGAVYCILDGLDECDKGSLQVLLKKLRDIFSSKHPEPPFQHFNLIVVSRDAPDSIPELLSNMPRIRLDPDADSEVNDDIRRFIEVKVNKLSAVRGYPEELRVYVGKVFQDRAQGTFLWVGIVARALWEYGSTEVEKALDLFPPSLEEIYARILLQININRQEIAAKILRWVIMAVRPLSLSELSVAIDTPVEPSTVAFSHDEVMKEQVSYCGQFLSINQKDEVNLIHQSAKDYLLRKTPDPVPELEAFRVKEEIGNLEIARKCFDYLQNDALIDDEDRLYFAKQGTLSFANENRFTGLETFPFLSYASLHWPTHAKSLARSDNMFNLSQPFYKRKSLHRAHWLFILSSGFLYSTLPFFNDSWMLGFASWFGILPLVENLLPEKGSIRHLTAEAKRFVVKERDLDGNTALHLASQCGHEAVLRLLLNHRRAYINIRNRNGRTALHLAISHEQEAVVRLLLDKGARTEAKDSDQTTALHIAAMRGHETVIRLLLDRGALIEVKNRWEHTALHLAAMCGHETAIRLLLDRKAHIDVKDDHEYTALHLAVRDRHETAIRLLLNREAHIEAKNKWKRTALHLAARNGHEIAIRLLLNKGAFIEAKDEDSETALHWAAEKGHETAVRLLLDRGAHIDHKDNKYGLTALHRAARVGHETTIRLLLDRGAQIEAKTNTTESTALHIAALNGHSAAIRVLLDKGAYIEAHKISGETALCLAAPKGHKTAIRLLLENGANVNAQNSSGETAADIARRVRQEVDIEEQPWYDSVIQLLTTSTIR